MIGYSIPYKADDRDEDVLYCPNCKKAELYQQLHEIYVGKVKWIGVDKNLIVLVLNSGLKKLFGFVKI